MSTQVSIKLEEEKSDDPMKIFQGKGETVIVTEPPNEHANSTRADFHDYAELTAELQSIATNYSHIAKLYDLGESVQGRTIWGLKITDNPEIEENEVEVRFCGAHHGDEYMSVELPLLLAWDLVQNYTVNTTITNYIKNREIWIIPLVNPDGREMNQRYNANYVDLNRDYGYMWSGAGGSSSPFSQPETQAIREHALKNNFVLSYSYHTTAQYVNYVWNYKPQTFPDEPMIMMISNVYGDLSGYTPTNGYDWYQITGDTNDFSYGCRGDLDTTIETYNSNIAVTWGKNRDAMYYAIDIADMGLSGVVTDAQTNEPIEATVWVEEVYWPCYTDPAVGDYHRLLFPGTYTVHFRANGYEEKVKTVTITDANATNILNASLQPSNSCYAYQVTMCEYFDHYSNPSEAISALGPPDNISASLGNGGMIVLDMGNNTVLKNHSGDDVIVYEQGDNEGYDAYVSQQWNGPWQFLGTGQGTTSFDLSSTGLESARFIKIIDDDITYSDGYPGCDIDAIQGLAPLVEPLDVTSLFSGWNFISIPSVHSFSKSNMTIISNNENYSWQHAVDNGLVDEYVFGWNRSLQRYYFTDTFQTGNGYWVYAVENCTLWIQDHIVEYNQTITPLLSQWDAIGINGDYQLPKQNITLKKNMVNYEWDEAVTEGFVNNYIFTWNAVDQVYAFSDKLLPGQAYWLYAMTDLLMIY